MGRGLQKNFLGGPGNYLSQISILNNEANERDYEREEKAENDRVEKIAEALKSRKNSEGITININLLTGVNDSELNQDQFNKVIQIALDTAKNISEDNL